MARPPKFNQEKANELKAEGKRIIEISKILNCSYGSLKTYFCRMRKADNKEKVTNELNKTLTNESESKTNMQDENKTESELKKEKQEKIVISMMNKGKTEQEIAEHYGWSTDDIHMIILQYQLKQCKQL